VQKTLVVGQSTLAGFDVAVNEAAFVDGGARATQRRDDRTMSVHKASGVMPGTVEAT
jgi:hypothetical protein